MFLIPRITTAGIVRSPMMSQFVMYVILTIVTWAMCAWVERRPLRSVGLGLHERTMIELVQGIVLGTAMMSVIFFVTVATGMSEFHWKALTMAESASLIGWGIAEFTIVAWGEELLFRGYLFQTLAEGTNRLIAVGAFALFFAFIHKSNPNATTFSLVNIAFAGVWLSAAYLKTRGLWLPIGLHFSWNYFQNNVFSFPVSGMQMADRQLGVLTDKGPAWLTGGSFGPEGGALTTVLLIVSTLFIWYSPIFRPSPSAWTPAEIAPATVGGDAPQAERASEETTEA